MNKTEEKNLLTSYIKTMDKTEEKIVEFKNYTTEI